MKLVRVALPLAATLAVGTADLYAVQASPLPVPPPAPAPKPSALLPVPSSTVFVLLPNNDTNYKGARIMLRSMTRIPPCRFIFGPYSRVGRTVFVDGAGRPLSLPASPQVSSSAGKPPVPR